MEAQLSSPSEGSVTAMPSLFVDGLHECSPIDAKPMAYMSQPTPPLGKRVTATKHQLPIIGHNAHPDTFGIRRGPACFEVVINLFSVLLIASRIDQRNDSP
jgi:hypothetical protein